MGTISDKLMRIINTKEDIRQALISKGYDVPTSIPFKEYAKMILDLPCKADSFPDIEGIVARYSASGLTNEQMAENPVWVDKTGNGHDLQLKNLAWGGMSGVGGYEMNFNLWRSNVSGIPDISMSTTTTSVSVSVGNSTYNNNLIYIHISNWDINKNHWLKVTSTYEDGDLAFIFYNNSNIKKIGLPANGYVNILAYPEFKGNYMYISTTSNKQGSFTIEQLPLYPGALVFDGVDDYGVCENFPILTKEKGYTVVALRQWITRGEIAQGLVSNVKNWLKDGAFLLEYRNIQADHLNKPISFGAIGSENDLPHILTYQTSKSYNGVSITTGNFEGTDVLHVGKLAPTNVGTCINAAIWELVFLDHDATEEELTKIKDYFVKTYPWLFPDQAWTVVGKTNEDEDRATIANITGNGNDLVLSNFGFAEGSGYGSYFWNFKNFQDWNTVTEVTNSKIVLKGSASNFWGSQIVKTVGEELHIVSKVKVTGLTDEMPKLYFGKFDTGDKLQLTNGINNINKIIFAPYGWYGFGFEEAFESCNVTIEQIPEYEGYLVTDGVDDIASSNIVVYEADFTFIGEWKFIQKDDTVAGINSVSHLYIQNRYNRGATVMINSTFENKKNITDYMTFKAITSKGKGYDENWNEVDLLYGDGNKGLSQVSIGGQGGSDFCHMIFKNMALYMNKVFSKDECIKAYNYLQTIKAK